MNPSLMPSCLVFSFKQYLNLSHILIHLPHLVRFDTRANSYSTKYRSEQKHHKNRRVSSSNVLINLTWYGHKINKKTEYGPDYAAAGWAF